MLIKNFSDIPQDKCLLCGSFNVERKVNPLFSRLYCAGHLEISFNAKYAHLIFEDLDVLMMFQLNYPYQLTNINFYLKGTNSFNVIISEIDLNLYCLNDIQRTFQTLMNFS